MSHHPQHFPLLSTPRLQLTALKPAHAQPMFSLFTDSRVTAHYLVRPLDTVQDMEHIIDMFTSKYASGEMIRWAITLASTSGFIGTIGVQQLQRGNTAAVVYALFPHHWHKGYAAEALDAVLAFGFGDLALKTIEAEVMPGNIASAKTLLHAGFIKENASRKVLWAGATYSMELYTLRNNK